jgi:hypothetical protein
LSALHLFYCLVSRYAGYHLPIPEIPPRILRSERGFPSAGQSSLHRVFFLSHQIEGRGRNVEILIHVCTYEADPPRPSGGPSLPDGRNPAPRPEE